MSKLTVKEYSIINKVSVQSVYKHIKNGNIDAQTIDNTKYIIIEDKIDYERKFNDLTQKYDRLNDKLRAKEELIEVLKENNTFLDKFIEYRKEVEPLNQKKKKKKKKDKDKKKKKKKK